MKKNKGFTLVEILMVVIILGILAAIVIPQFTEASNYARESALASDLQTARSQVELFKVQHKDEIPGAADGVTFLQALTDKTDIDGALDAAGNYGPYLQTFPTNPFNDRNTVDVQADDTGLGGGNHGWYFNTSTGKISPDDDEHYDM